MYIFRLLLLAVIYFSLNSTIFTQSYSIKGQFCASGESVEDNFDIKSQLVYIPTLSLYYELSQDRMFDLELAYKLGRSYIGYSLVEHHEKFYRSWLRYSTKVIEARLGLQKVSFGPARVLRPLAWFDTIYPEDPTDQTEGVEAFRLRFFPSNSLTVWAWIMKGESDTLSYGGRGELSTNLGEWGFTFHKDPAKSPQLIGQYPILITGSHTRAGVDFRYDGYIGFWFESAGFFIIENQEMFDIDRHSLITMGADYTLPIGTGLLILLETMRSEGWSSKTDESSNQTISAFMASLPVGMFHHVMLISNLDWDKQKTYNYLRWSSTYNRFSINCMLSINSSAMSNSLKLMLIYNH